MILSSSTKKPKIHSSAYVAPTATISGDVTIGAGTAVLHGAIVVAEGAAITIGSDCVIMENAVVKSSGGTALQFPVSIGDAVIVGPHAYVSGANIAKGAFLASGARVYNGVAIGENASVGPGETRQQPGNFFENVFNLPATKDASAAAAHTYAKHLRKLHAQDAIVGDGTHATTTKAPPRRSIHEEPPQQQMTEVEGVMDAMMLELQEMEALRKEAQKKKPK